MTKRMALFAQHFLAIWLKLEQTLATVSHGRVDNEVCLSDYETTFPVTYDWHYAIYYRHMTMFVSDPGPLAALNLENSSELLRISQIVRRASLDNLEVTAMTQFLIAYYGENKAGPP
ncbi:hypothetical protein AAVH_17721 [Aphelenchoides avenae]|nr:hypothetical protein AAVH_17721 [Aphelenchus avenae]